MVAWFIALNLGDTLKFLRPVCQNAPWHNHRVEQGVCASAEHTEIHILIHILNFVKLNTYYQ